MKCPVCLEANLVMSERQGIEIDYCAQCRGVWLDRGELDKIIERATLPANAPVTAPLPVPTLPQPIQPPLQQPPLQPQVPSMPQGRAPDVTIYNTQPAPRRDDYNRDYDDDDDDYKRHGYRKRKKGGFLGELFDFD